MAKIADVINLKTGYADFVELKDAFDASQENADRMAMYRPTKAHRTAFEKLCRGLYQPNDKKFYLLSGSYGTGKSHLCLMYANFLNRSSGDPDIVGFYQNYERLDAETTKMLRNIRKDGQYLVAICDYHSGRRFEDVVLKAIFEACEKKDLDVHIQTQFDEAERFIANWESKSSSTDGQQIRNFYQDFTAALERVAPGMTIDQLCEDLNDYNSESLGTFRRAFKEMMAGLEFQPQAGNLIPIVRNLVRSAAFKERFKGLAILFDEFGFTLEKASYSKDVLQGFMETICKNEPNVIFVGCIHKNFKAYADRFSQDDASVMSARITPVDLFNEGIEEIIGAIVETDKESDIWLKEIFPKTGIFDQLVPICKTLNLFPWIEDIKRIRQQVLEDIYGVHPMALACLLRLSSEIGSNARSTFTYFSGKVGGADGSYADFIEKSEITIGAGKLNLYTVDQLFTFFKPELSQKNPELRDRQRQLVNGYYASLDTLRKVSEQELFNEQFDDHIKILRSILIYQLCQVPTTLEAIQFGQYCLTKSEGKQVENNLKFLTKTGSVFYRQHSKTYELALGVGEDPYDLIERYINDPSLHPDDLVASFLKEAGNRQELEFLEAKQYNLHFSEDKRFKRYFVPAKDIGDKLWQKIINDWENDFNRVKRSFEGAVVYALCENETDIQLAKDAINDIPKSNFALAVPHSAQPFTDTLLRVKACFHFLPPNEAEKISAQTESRMRDILENPEDGFLPNLKRILRTIADGDEACWYGQYGRIIVDRPQQAHKPADMLCEALYKERCLIKHPDLNYIHDNRWLTNRNSALKQAVDILLTAEKVFIDNGNPDSHGQKRYLEKVLFKGAGALKKVGEDGKIIYFDCDCNPQHISDDFPALKKLCSQMQQLNASAMFPIGNFINDIKSSPYGVGGPALVLLVAHVVRAFGERLRIYTDTTKTNEFTFGSYDDVVQIVNDPATKLVFEIRDISPAKVKLIDGIAKVIHAPALKYGETRTLKSTYESLIN